MTIALHGLHRLYDGDLRRSSAGASAWSGACRGSSSTSAATPTAMIAAAPNAHCTPPTNAAAGVAPASSSVWDRDDSTVTDTAVPIAAKTCWVVPRNDEPWE